MSSSAARSATSRRGSRSRQPLRLPTLTRRNRRGRGSNSDKGPRVVRLVLVIGLALAIGRESTNAQTYSRGQTASPAFEGWEKNADGSFNFLFGYMNRNWEEEIDVPIGPENNIEPGGPDQGQPTRLLPRRNRFVFRVRVPADWGQKE